MRLLGLAAWLCTITGLVLLIVNDPGLPYGERRAGWELLLFVGGAGVLLLLWVLRDNRRKGTKREQAR